MNRKKHDGELSCRQKRKRHFVNGAKFDESSESPSMSTQELTPCHLQDRMSEASGACEFEESEANELAEEAADFVSLHGIYSSQILTLPARCSVPLLVSPLEEEEQFPSTASCFGQALGR